MPSVAEVNSSCVFCSITISPPSSPMPSATSTTSPAPLSKSLSGSHSNEAEAEVCRQIILALLRKNVRPASLAIIVFYKEQSRLLEHFAKRTQVDIHTVDSVQGREKDIVVLLTTRTKRVVSRTISKLSVGNFSTTSTD
ncbi:hypothetical protein COOONC_27693 [Cooperia oncophora]